MFDDIEEYLGEIGDAVEKRVMDDLEVQEIAAVIARELGSTGTYTCGFCGAQVPIGTDEGHVGGACAPRREVSPREREDDERRGRHDESVDPWGYDDPPQERTDD